MNNPPVAGLLIKESQLDIEGNDFVQQLIWSSVLGDWVAYYLAYEYEQDPTPVEMVELLKKQLND